MPDGQTLDTSGAGTTTYQHGTLVLSQLAGATKGVAPKIKAVLHEVNHNEDTMYLIDHLDNVEGDWRQTSAHSPNPLAIINISFGRSKSDISLGFEISFNRHLKSLIGVGVVPIVSAGNTGLEISVSSMIPS